VKTLLPRTSNRRSNLAKRRSFLSQITRDGARRLGRRLQVESLEERRLLATLYVDNTPTLGGPGADVFTASGGDQVNAGGLTLGTNLFTTIGAAVAAANPSDTINVADGTYAEQVAANKAGLIFQGNQYLSDGRDLTRGTETFVTGTGNGGLTPISITASDVQLSGFTIEGNTSAVNLGFGIVLGAGTAGSEIRNNVVQNNLAGLSLANNSAVNPTIIERNLFRNNNNPGSASGSAIYSDQFNAGGALTNVLIQDNTFSGNVGSDGFSGTAINLSSTLNGSQSDIDITRNVFSGNGRSFLAFNLVNSSFTQNEISGSVFVGSADIRLFEGVNNLVITNNLMTGTALDVRAVRISNIGTGAPSATNITFEGNSVSGYKDTTLDSPTNDDDAGIQIDSGAYTGTLSAQNNWWGSPTGPTTPNNPGGTGEEIIDPNNQVDFSPFLASGVDTQPGTPGFQGNLVSPLGIAVVGTPDDDVVIVIATSENDGSYQVITNGVPGPVVPFTDIVFFSAALLADNDTLIINNPVGGLFAPSLGIFYNGGGQAGDALSNRGGAATSGRYTPGPTNDAGVITHDGTFDQTITFTGLAPTDDTVAEANFTIDGTAAANAITISNGPIVALVQTVNVAIDAFEPINFGNKTNVDINALGGGDTILTNFTTNAAGLVTLDEFGHSDTGVGDDNANDIFDLRAYPAAVSLLASGQGGTDYFNNLTTANLDPLAGPLTINGGETAADGDVARLHDSSDAGPDTVTFDRTSPTVGTIADAAGGLITYTNLEVMLFESTAAGDTINVLATLAGTNYYVTGNGGGDTVTIGNQTADFNAVFDGSLDNIQGEIIVTGEFNPAGPGATDTLNVDDSGTVAANVASIGINPAFNFVLPAPAPGGTDSGPATELVGFGPAAIRYRHTDSTFLPAAFNNRMEFVNVLSGSGNDTIAVNATTATNTTTLNTRQGNDSVTIAGDNLGASNLISGFDGTDTFNLNITTHLGATAFAAITGLNINGNDPAATSESRDRLNINDNNAAFARNLNFDHLDTAGDLDILPGAAGAGYAGPVNLTVNVRGMETIVTTSTSDNDTVRVTGTSADDNLTAVPRSAGRALVFLNGNPYLNAPPDSLATFLPGLAGGGRGPDLSLDGIAGNLTLDGGAVSGEGNRAIVQGVSENNITTGGALDIFGFGAGVLIPGAGAGNAYDTINVTDSLVTINNIAQGPLTPVALVTASFNQTSADTPFQRAGLIVNGGDEAVAQASGIADNITALVSPVFNIQVNGNLPTLVLGPDGLPRGDQLNITGPGDINIFSDKATPPNVTVTFSGNPGPFGVRHSSIERLLLDAGSPPASGAVNLIGDNNNPAVDQNDNFVVRGRDIDGNLLDAGYQEMTVSINGSAPILINGVQRLDVLGDDAALTPSVGPNDIDTLDIRAYADNGANPPNNAPRGWGVDVFFHEGNPAGADGNQADLLIYHTSAGLGGGGSVSENVVVQPSGPDNGEVRATNAVDGSEIVVIQYVANTDIIVLDDDLALADTDTLTLNGTNPNTPQVSGSDRFAANFTAAGTLADPLVTVADTVSGLILYRLRNFTGFSSINLEPLAGADTIAVTPRAGLTVNVNGGLPSAGAAGVPSDLLAVSVPFNATITQGADSTTGQVTSAAGPVNFAAVETVSLISGDAGALVVNATDDNDTIAVADIGGADLIWVNDGPVINFQNFSTLTIEGRFGSDEISVSPGGIDVATINVNAGSPTASDKLVVNGIAGTDDELDLNPTGVGAGTVVSDAGAPNVVFTGIEHLTLVMQEADGDEAEINGTTGNDQFEFTPGATRDTGLFTGTMDLNDATGVGPFALVPTTVVGVDPTDDLDINNGTVGGTDSFIFNGTAGNDLITADVDVGNARFTLQVNGQILARIDAFNIASALVRGHDGDDTFNHSGAIAVPVAYEGGNPSASDTLNYTGSGDPITSDLAAQTIAEVGSGTVSYSGVERVNIDATAAAVTVVGSANNDQIAVSHDAGLVTQFSLAGSNSLVRVSDVGASLTLDTLAGTDVVTVLGTAAADTAAVTYGATTTVAVTGQQVLSITSANLEQLTLSTGAGNDAVTLNGNATITTLVDMGDPNANDVLTYNVAANARVTQAAISTNGKIDQTGGSDVDYIGVEVLNMNSAAAGSTLTAQGTHDNDTFAVGNVGITAIWINDGTVIRYNALTDLNFANVIVAGRFGSDSFSVTPHAGVAITVQGGDPTASDTVLVNGTAAGETIVFTPTAADAATVLVGAFPVVTLTTVEHLTINGRGGDDTLTTVTPAAVSSTIEITPGATRDSGSVQVDSLLPMAFTTLGLAGRLAISDATIGDRDRVIYNGTAADNVFRVPSSAIPAPSLELVGQISVGTTSVESYVLRGLGGDDTFEVTAQTDIIVDVQGGDPGNSDVLNFTSTGATILRTGSSQIDDAGVAGTPDVIYSGVETINLDANQNSLTVEGAANDDDLTVTVYSATSGKVELGLAVQQNGQVGPSVAKPLINYSNITGPLAIDQLGGEDTLVVVGNALTQTFIVNASAAPFDPPPAGGLVAPPTSVVIDDLNDGTSDGVVTYVNSESLEVFGLEGSDTFEVAPGAIPVFVDGGDPIGVPTGDLIRVAGVFAYVAGPEVDEGGALSGGEVVSWDHIEQVQITPDADCPFLILGTNADDDITVIARDASYNAAADGVRDFTFSVNAGPDILITNLPDIPASPDLFIDARSGDDDIVLRTPAPNDADWDVDVQVAGGPPSIGELNEGDRLVLETPNEDSIVFNPTGPDTGNIVVDEDADLAYTEGSTDSRVAFGPFTFVCPDVEFTYVSSPGGVELVEYDGEDDDELDPSFNSAADIVRINAIGITSTTTVTPAGSTQGIGNGTFVSPLSPVFHFRAFDDLTIGGVGFDHVIVNTTENADVVTSDADSVIFGTSEVTLLATVPVAVEKLTLNTLGGNDNVNLDLTSPTLQKTINAGAGNDIVDLAGSVDADIFGGIGDDTLIGSPAADNIFGGAGNDIIIGGGGVDNEYGEDGNDRFGDLLLTGNGVADDPGADFMFGGDGIDQFIWEPGDGADVIQGGVDGVDILRFFGGVAAETFTLNPAAGAPTHFNITINAAPTIDTHGVEQIIVSGLGGADDFIVADLTPTEVESVLIDVGLAGDADDVRVIGRTVSDNVSITVPVAGRVNIAGLDYDVDILGVALADVDTLAFEGREGNDTILSSDGLNALFSPAEVIIVAGAGDDFVSGFGTMFGDDGNDTLVGGAFVNEIHGGAGDDQIFGGGAADNLFGDAGEDTFVPGFDGLVDSIDGGADFDTILVQGNSANNRIDARQDAIGQVSYEVSGIGGGDGVLGGVGTESDVIVPGTVEELEILAGSGDDLIRVSHSDGLIALAQQAFSLRFTVDGGAPGASDRLTVTDEGLGDTTIHRVGGIAGNGSYAVGALAPVVYTDIEFASLNPINPVTGGTGADGLGTLFVFKHDPFEENNSRLNATFLGSNSAINIDPTIDPGADALFGLPGDEDWYRVVPQFNGDLDIRVFFRQQGLLANGRAGLPGNGDLDIALYDADGAPVAIAGTGLFGTNDATDDERIRIPAVAGQTYYLRVKGAALLDTASASLNVYNVSVINTPAATPIDLELDDVIGVATVDAAPGPTATSFDATAVAPFTLSTVNDFYNGKDIVFTSGNLNGIRGRILDYVGASQTFVFAAGTFFAAPTAGSQFQIESADTGRSQFDNITRDTTPTIFLRVPNVINLGGVATLDDVPFNGTAPGNPPDEFIGIPFVPTANPQVVDATAPGFRVAIFVTEHGTSDQGPPNFVLAGYASPVDVVNRPGLFSFTFSPNTLITELPVFPGTSETTSFFISARLEMIDPAQPQQAQGYGDFAESLEIVVDTQPPPVFFGLPNDADDGLLPDSDTGLNTNPETLTDLVTSDTTPGFFGQAEADAVIRLFIDAPELGFPTGDGVFEPAIDFQIGFDVAEPFDGTNQYPNGYWQVDAVNVNLNAAPFSPVDGLRRIFVTAEDVAGNINPEVGQVVQELEIFIDTQGPQITDVTVNAPSGSIDDVYNLFDPKPSTDGPTPLVNSIFIEIRDLPNRVLPLFDQPAFKPDIAENPGHYLLTGDYNGIIPILDVNVFLDPAVNGQPATGRVELVFRTEGGDGVFNTSDDIGAALPDDRFTLFVNDEGIIDFAGNIGDFESNADEPHDSPPGTGEPDVLGVDGVPTGDGLPGGDFLARFTVDTRPELGVWAAGSAFLDINGNTIWDPDNGDFTNRDITHVLGYVSDDLFAGRFATDDGEGGLIDDGFDKLAAYGRVSTNIFRWLIDTDNDGVADIEVAEPAGLGINGLPVAGNFALGVAGDEVGVFTGSRWHLDTDGDFSVVDAGGSATINWAFAGHGIVGDFDGDGLDDLASWSDDTFRFDLSSIGGGGPLAGNPGLNGTIDRTFKFGFAGPGERPVAADMNQDGIEDVGLWMPARDGITPRGQAEWYFLVSGVTQNDTPGGPAGNIGPTIPGTADPTPGSYLAVGDPAENYGVASYLNGRIVVDPLFPGANIVRFQPVPFGNDQYMQFGDEFALPLVGNFDPPVSSDAPANPSVNPRNAYDVNNDGRVNQIDLLAVVNYLTVEGVGPAPSGGFISAPFVDVNDDLFCNSADLLVLLNYLTVNPPTGQGGAGESGAEGEGGNSRDSYFTRLGLGDGDDDDLIELLARG